VAALEARELVAGSFLEGAPIVPVSARTGAGLEELRHALAALGGTAPRQSRRGVARLPIDRVFSVRGFGTVVTGTLVSGEIAAGADLVALPEGRDVRVRGVQVHGREVTSVSAPSRAAVNLGAVETRELSRGVTLSSPEALVVTRRVDVRIEMLGDARPLRHGTRVRVHHGTAERLGRVAICAVAGTSRRDWRLAAVGESSVAVDGGGDAFARIRLEQPMALTRGDRLILRAYSPPATIGGAVVLDPAPVSSGLRRPAVLERFRAIDPDGAAQTGVPPFVTVWLKEAGERGLTSQTLVARGGLDPDASRQTLAALVDARLAVAISTVVVDREIVRAVEVRILEELATYHRAHPREPGLSREELRERVAPRASPLVDHLLTAMTTSRAIVGADRVALASHRVESTPDEEQNAALVEAVLRGAGLTPPDLAGIAAAAGLPAPAVEQALKALARSRRIVRLEALCFHVDELARLKREVQQLAASRPATSPPVTVDVAAFKERYGLSRKYAIPLLEWLDRERVTRRVGDARVILGGGS
jgi:selenocysteine-specific elongation factor